MFQLVSTCWAMMPGSETFPAIKSTQTVLSPIATS